MNIKAKTMSNDNELTPNCIGLYGARFYSDRDPLNENNKVVKIYTVNTTHNVSSTTNIEGKSISPSPTSFVFEMRYYFEKLWYYSAKYFRIEFCNNANASAFSMIFNVKEGEPQTSASVLTCSLSTDPDNAKIELHSDRWYNLRFEYYRDVENYADSRLKMFIREDGEELGLVKEFRLNGRSELPCRALLIHSATKIRGVQYLDDVSFTLCDKVYSPSQVPVEFSKSARKIYDFEDGIPSEKEFYVDMRLKKMDDFLSMDPALWNTSGNRKDNSSVNEFYELLLVQTGEAHFISGLQETPIFEGSIVIVPPKVRYDVVSEQKYNIISISGAFEQLSRFTEPVILHDNIYHEGKKIAELALYNRFNNEEYFTSLCNCFINFVMLNISSPQGDMSAIVYKMMDDIKKNYDNSEFSVVKLLRGSGYAKDYIRLKFTEIAKMTPKKYLTSVRMKKAKELINIYGADVSIARIAEQCGIVDPAVFSKCFKQFYGVSPKQFLKRD